MADEITPTNIAPQAPEGAVPFAPPQPAEPSAPSSAPAAPPSLRESLDSAVATVDKPVAATPSTPSAGPARDAQGRFVSSGAAAAQGVAAVTPATPVTPAQQPAAPTTPAFDVSKAPESWRTDARALWDTVPEPVRGYVHQREQELQAGFQQIAQTRQAAEGVLREFAPYADILQAEGATPVMAMRTLLATAHALRTGGPEYRKAILLQLAQQYGVDFTSPLNAELLRTQARVAELEQQQLQHSTSQQQQMTNEVTQAFNAFANDPGNEFFPHVRGIMAGLIRSGIANDLKSAYAMSLGVHPEVRAEIMRREVAAQTNAAAAQRASGLSVTGAPAGGAVAAVKPNGQAMSLRESLERAFEGR